MSYIIAYGEIEMSHDPNFSNMTNTAPVHNTGVNDEDAKVITPRTIPSPHLAGENGIYINKSIEAVDESILALKNLNKSIEKFLAQ